MAIFTKIKNYLYRELVVPIVNSKDSPKLVARGATVGMFVAMTPTVGVQMSIVVVFGLIPGFHFNLPVAIAMVWLSNPVTVLPLYYLFYLVGLTLMGQQGDSWQDFTGKISEILHGIEQYPFFEKMYHGVVDFFGLGLDYAIPMWIGSLLVATLLCIPTYPLTYWIAQKYGSRSSKEPSSHSEGSKTSASEPPPKSS